jgi:hypothetical protein
MKEFLFGAAAIVLAGAAVAQTAAPPAHQGHGAMAPHAAPGIGREQTRDQVVAKVREHFARLDTNRDNVLTKAEAEAGRAAMRSMRAERRASRGDRADRLQRRDPAVAFDRLDSNKDGSISRDEFAKGRELRIKRRVERQGAAGADGRRMKMRHMGGGMIGGHMFAMADANKDERVSLDEATNAAVQHFDMIDANRDGRITPEEHRTMRRHRIEQRRAPKAS